MHRWLHENFDRIIPLTIHLNKKITLEAEGFKTSPKHKVAYNSPQVCSNLANRPHFSSCSFRIF